MSCAHAYVPQEGCEGILSIDAAQITYGRGALREVGELTRGLGCKRVAVFTDVRVARLAYFDTVLASLKSAGIDAVVYDKVRVEPTDGSFLAAAAFAREGRFDGYVSVGGGSVIDTCKAAALYATYPADFLTYVNKPVGVGTPVPGALPPHIACPTTSGTGSELTGIAVCDVEAIHAKTGIASRRLRPTLAVVDPDVTATLPASVVAASGFDVLCHALESFTARPFTKRLRPDSAAQRPMSQGSNPWSDMGSAEALRLTGAFLVRAVNDASDHEARERMMWAATLAGLAFGNAGVHVPHAMAYAIAGVVHEFHMPDYPVVDTGGFVPHGISVIVGAPAAFRFTARADGARHLEAARHLVSGANTDANTAMDVRDASESDAAAIVAAVLERLMRATAVPRNLTTLGYSASHLEALVRGTMAQRRLLDNAPVRVGEPELTALFEATM